jgi:predicted DNA-binding antitoxin AbrB/MazE fold protein
LGKSWTVSRAAEYTFGMSQTIAAVFDSGVFRPLEPVDLAEGTQVLVQVTQTADAGQAELSAEELTQQQAAIAEFLARMEALPDEGPDDGFSGRDHDKILYGAP